MSARKDPTPAELLRPFQEMAAMAGGPVAAYAEQLATLTEAWTGPLRTLLQQQRVLAEQMAEWAERHRQMSEMIASWAEEHRRMTEQMARIVTPVLTQSEQLTELTRSWAKMMRPPR